MIGLRPILKKARVGGPRLRGEQPCGADRIGPLCRRQLRAGALHQLRAQPGLLGPRSALQPRPAQFRRDPLRLLRRRRRRCSRPSPPARSPATARSSAAKWAGRLRLPGGRRRTRWSRARSRISRPSGITGLVFNTRRPVFADWRVREALIHAFNFEFINQTLNGGAEPRITSYFANSDLAMDHGPAAGRVADAAGALCRRPAARHDRRLFAAVADGPRH